MSYNRVKHPPVAPPLDPSFLTSVPLIYQSSTGAASSSGGSSSAGSSEADEGTGSRDREGYICAVCLDVYFSPYMCHPCNHIFCEPCLRTLARNSPANTPCPLCRTVITHVFFQKGELTGTGDLLPRSPPPRRALRLVGAPKYSRPYSV